MTYDKTLFIEGKWEAGEGESNRVVNPKDESTLAEIASATTAQTQRALETSQKAQVRWKKLSPVERGSYLREISQVLIDNTDELSQLCMDEVGKPYSEAKSEVDNAAAYSTYTAEWDRRIEGEILPSDDIDETIHLMRMPYGVVSAISAWNYPIELYFRKVAPALLTGNTIVLKPSEVAPLTSIAITRLIHDNTSLPEGVLNLLTGAAETGKSMVINPLTSMIGMTGHRDTGKKIMRLAADNLTPVSLELGGSAPAIVWADADLDVAVDALINARHENCGQACTSAERIYVHKDIYREFLDRYVAACDALSIGEAIGPLVNAAQYGKVERAVETAKNQGATIATGGGRPANYQSEKGYWFQPTVITDFNPGSGLETDEIFGPVSPIMPISSIDEALAFANNSRYGLSAYFFGNDYKVLMKTAHELEFGELYINRTHGEALQGHHIGHKESGIGGEDGKYGTLKYTQLKTAYHKYA